MGGGVWEDGNIKTKRLLMEKIPYFVNSLLKLIKNHNQKAQNSSPFSLQWLSYTLQFWDYKKNYDIIVIFAGSESPFPKCEHEVRFTIEPL